MAVLLARMPCLSSGLPLLNPSASASTHKPAGSTRGQGQNGVNVSHATVANPLLAPGDAVAHNLATFFNWLRFGRHGGQIAACLWLSGPVGTQQRFFGNTAEPILLLFLGSAPTLIGSEPKKGSQYPGGNAQINRGHQLGDAVNVVRAAAQPVVLFGDEEQVQADGHRVVQRLEDVVGKGVVVVEVEQEFGG